MRPTLGGVGVPVLKEPLSDERRHLEPFGVSSITLLCFSNMFARQRGERRSTATAPPVPPPPLTLCIFFTRPYCPAPPAGCALSCPAALFLFTACPVRNRGGVFVMTEEVTEDCLPFYWP